MPKARKPDYRLCVLNKVTNAKGQVGVAWLNEDKSVSIVLNHRVVLEQSMDDVLTLFPANTLPTDTARTPPVDEPTARYVDPPF